jgi:hypothetical protein
LGLSSQVGAKEIRLYRPARVFLPQEAPKTGKKQLHGGDGWDDQSAS